MRHYIRYFFTISLGRMREKCALLLVVLALALGTVVVAARVAEDYFDGDDFRLNVALVILDDDENMNDLARLVLTTGDIRRNYNIIQLDTTAEGVALVENGQVYACIVLPQGFFTGLQTGENLAPQVILNSTDGVDASIATALVDVLVDMMRLTQSGIYYATDVVLAEGELDGSFFLDSNLAYLSRVLSRSDSFVTTTLAYEAVLDLPTHYALTLAIYFLLLATPLFYDSLNRGKNFPLMKQLSTLSSHHHTLYFVQLAPLVLLYTTLLLAVTVALGGGLTPMVALAALNGGLLLVLCQGVLFQLIPQYMSAIVLNFAIHTAGLVVVGGVIPTLLLPPAVSILAPLSPIYHIRTLLSGGLVTVDYFGIYNIGIVATNGLLLVWLWYINEKSVREEGERSGIS